MKKPILCLDFDGVLHSYTSGWKGADEIPDPPVDGAIDFIIGALEHFRVAIFSSRSNQKGGIPAMQAWLEHWLWHHFDLGNKGDAMPLVASYRDEIEWPTEKPPAMITIDDRAITFDGTWPNVTDLLEFRPWNKR